MTIMVAPEEEKAAEATTGVGNVVDLEGTVPRHGNSVHTAVDGHANVVGDRDLANRGGADDLGRGDAGGSEGGDRGTGVGEDADHGRPGDVVDVVSRDVKGDASFLDVGLVGGRVHAHVGEGGVVHGVGGLGRVAADGQGHRVGTKVGKGGQDDSPHTSRADGDGENLGPEGGGGRASDKAGAVDGNDNVGDVPVGHGGNADQGGAGAVGAIADPAGVVDEAGEGDPVTTVAGGVVGGYRAVANIIAVQDGAGAVGWGPAVAALVHDIARIAHTIAAEDTGGGRRGNGLPEGCGPQRVLAEKERRKRGLTVVVGAAVVVKTTAVVVAAAVVVLGAVVVVETWVAVRVARRLKI